MAAILIIASCSTSRITQSWKDSDTSAIKYSKILVLGLINDTTGMLREQMEAHIASDLKDLGYNAVCSCDEFSPKAFDKMNEQQALDKLTSSGVDAVLTIVLFNKTKEKYYVPSRMRFSPYDTYHNQFWGYYRTMYNRVYTPGYLVEDTKYFWESNFYELGDKKLIYSAKSQSFNPGNEQALGHEYGKMIIKDMVKKEVLETHRKK